LPTPIHPALRDTVIGRFQRDRLSAALAAMHRAGFGPHARVFDGGRGDLAGQLRRANLTLPLHLGDNPDAVLLVVTAPGRGSAAAEMLLAAGAHDVVSVARGATATTTAPDPVPAAQPPSEVDLADPNDG